ncbi:hypothetical protein ACS0PU_002731 [Formica fusca]
MNVGNYNSALHIYWERKKFPLSTLVNATGYKIMKEGYKSYVRRNYASSFGRTTRKHPTLHARWCKDKVPSHLETSCSPKKCSERNLFRPPKRALYHEEECLLRKQRLAA